MVCRLYCWFSILLTTTAYHPDRQASADPGAKRQRRRVFLACSLLADLLIRGPVTKGLSLLLSHVTPQFRPAVQPSSAAMVTTGSDICPNHCIRPDRTTGTGRDPGNAQGVAICRLISARCPRMNVVTFHQMHQVRPAISV